MDDEQTFPNLYCEAPGDSQNKMRASMTTQDSDVPKKNNHTKYQNKILASWPSFIFSLRFLLRRNLF